METVPTTLKFEQYGNESRHFKWKSGDTMKIGFIGAGKVGCSLGKYLINGNVQVTGYYSRHKESAQEAADFTNTKVYNDQETLVRENDAIFITVPDGQIRNTYDRIKEFNI